MKSEDLKIWKLNREIEKNIEFSNCYAQLTNKGLQIDYYTLNKEGLANEEPETVVIEDFDLDSKNLFEEIVKEVESYIDPLVSSVQLNK